MYNHVDEESKRFAKVRYDMNIRPVTPRERRAYLLGLTPEYIDHVESLKIKLVEARGVRCEMCGKGSKSTVRVHHRHYRTFLEEKLEDLVLMCPKCHKDLHARSRWKKLTKKDIPFVDPNWSSWLENIPE